MSLRFEDVIVQKPPARRVYCEHSLVTWRAPLRGEDSDNDRAPSSAATSAAAKPGTTFFGAAVSEQAVMLDRKSTRLNSSHGYISYAVFCLKKKKKIT